MGEGQVHGTRALKSPLCPLRRVHLCPSLMGECSRWDQRQGLVSVYELHYVMSKRKLKEQCLKQDWGVTFLSSNKKPGNGGHSVLGKMPGKCPNKFGVLFVKKERMDIGWASGLNILTFQHLPVRSTLRSSEHWPLFGSIFLFTYFWALSTTRV